MKNPQVLTKYGRKIMDQFTEKNHRHKMDLNLFMKQAPCDYHLQHGTCNICL